MGKQSMDALRVDFITNFDIDMMDATVAYCIVLYCNHRNERIAWRDVKLLLIVIVIVMKHLWRNSNRLRKIQE